MTTERIEHVGRRRVELLYFENDRSRPWQVAVLREAAPDVWRPYQWRDYATREEADAAMERETQPTRANARGREER